MKRLIVYLFIILGLILATSINSQAADWETTTMNLDTGQRFIGKSNGLPKHANEISMRKCKATLVTKPEYLCQIVFWKGPTINGVKQERSANIQFLEEKYLKPYRASLAKKEPSQTQKEKREVGVNIPYLGGSIVTVEYRKDNFVFYERLRLGYGKGCRVLELKQNGKSQNKTYRCKWSQSDLTFDITTRVGQGNERVFRGHFSSWEESNRIKEWQNVYEIKKGTFNYSKSSANGRLSGLIEFNLDEIAKVNPKEIEDKNLEEEKRKIAEEKRKIEEEKRKIAEAKKKQEEEEKQREEANAKLYIIGSGTGFFVSAEGHIVSNDHVVGICRKVASKIDGEIKYFNVIKTDEVNDLGIVKGEYKNPTYLSIKTDGAEYGEDIVAFGYPLADALSTSVKLTRGIVSSLSGPGNNYSEIQIDAAIQPGNSGGPVLNMEGQVVGVASSGLNKLYMLEQSEYIPENVNFAVAAPTLSNFLKANGVKVDTKKFEVNNTKELARIGRPATLQLFCMNTKALFEELKKTKKHSDVLFEKVIDLR